MSQIFDVQEPVTPVKQSRPWQFSIKALLVFMTACSVLFAMMLLPALALLTTLVSLLAMMIFCLTATIYGRGWIRPFAIGCGATLLLGFYWVYGAPFSQGEAIIYGLIQILTSVVAGFFGAASHGCLKRRMGVIPIPNIPFVRKWLVNPEE